MPTQEFVIVTAKKKIARKLRAFGAMFFASFCDFSEG